MADTTQSGKPAFENPPVVEVAVLVQFEPISDLTNADLFRLWSDTEFRNRYPDLAEYSELPPFFETFDDHSTQVAAEYERRRLVFRLNFRNPKLDEQFQVQRDRAGFYWQQGGANLTYPGHPHPLNRFWRDFEALEGFLASNELGEIRPNQCAMSYNNRLKRGSGWNRPEDLARVVTFLSNEFSHPPQLNVELDATAAIRVFRIKDSEDRPVARLYVGLGEAGPEYPNEMDLELVVRGAPRTPDRKGMQDFFQMAHEHIVGMFDSITTTEMHKLWDKKS